MAARYAFSIDLDRCIGCQACVVACQTGNELPTGDTFIMFVTVSVSGFVLWFGKGRLGPNGLASAAMAHDLSMLGLSVLMIGHVYFTFLYDALSAMLTGFVTEQYARLEHLKWLETLPPEAFAAAPEASNGAKASESDIKSPAE